MIEPYAPPEGWYLVAAERRRIEREEGKRVVGGFVFYTAGIEEAFRKIGESMRQVAESMQPAMKLLAEEQRRRERAVLSFGQQLAEVQRRLGAGQPRRGEGHGL